MAEAVSIVEISSSLPGDVPVWIDVSSSFRSVKTKRGKQRQQDRSQAGTATFVFSNADRKFDPENAAGALYAFLKPMRRIRHRATWNAVTYPVFDGYIDFIEQGYHGPHDAIATIAATDGFKRLESAYLPSVWENVVGIETYVKAWYRFDEPLDNTVLVEALSDHTGHGYTAYKVGTNVRSASGLLTDNPNSALQTPNNAAEGIALPDSLTPLALPWAIEFWMQAPRYDLGAAGFNTYARPILPFNGPDEALGQPGMLNAYTRNANDGINVDRIAFGVGSTGAPTSFIRATAPVFDNKPHHIVLVAEAGIPYKTYIDGVLSVLATTGNSEALPRQAMSLGVTPLSITFDELRIYQGLVPSAATVTAHYAAGAAPWANDTPNVRIGRVLDLIGWPAADRALSATGSPLQRTGLGGTALEHLLLIEETELGAVFMTADGKVKYIGRNELITGSYLVSQATFGDAVGEIGYVGMQGYRLSDDTVRNIIRRQREGGAEVVAEDATSKSTYGPKTEPVSSATQETSDAVAYDRANYRLSHVKDAFSYVAKLELEPRGNGTALFPLALGLDLATRITLRRRPQNVGALIQQDTTIQGIEHDVGPKKWRTVYYLDPTPTEKFFLFDSTLWDASDWRFSAA